MPRKSEATRPGCRRRRPRSCRRWRPRAACCAAARLERGHDLVVVVRRGRSAFCGSQTTSSLKTASPSITASTLRSRRAEVEADAAAVEVPAERRACLARRRHLVRRRTSTTVNGVLVDVSPMKSVVEGARAARRVGLRSRCSPMARRPADVDLPAAALPQQELDQPLDVASGSPPRAGGRRGRRASRSARAAVGSLQADHERHAAARGCDLAAEARLARTARAEAGIERRHHPRRDQGERVLHDGPPGERARGSPARIIAPSGTGGARRRARAGSSRSAGLRLVRRNGRSCARRRSTVSPSTGREKRYPWPRVQPYSCSRAPGPRARCPRR